MVHDVLLQYGVTLTYVLLFFGSLVCALSFAVCFFHKKKSVEKEADLPFDMPDHALAQMREQIEEESDYIISIESQCLTLEEDPYGTYMPHEDDVAGLCQTAEIISIIPRLQQKEALQHRKKARP